MTDGEMTDGVMPAEVSKQFLERFVDGGLAESTKGMWHIEREHLYTNYILDVKTDFNQEDEGIVNTYLEFQDDNDPDKIVALSFNSNVLLSSLMMEYGGRAKSDAEAEETQFNWVCKIMDKKAIKATRRFKFNTGKQLLTCLYGGDAVLTTYDEILEFTNLARLFRLDSINRSLRLDGLVHGHGDAFFLSKKERSIVIDPDRHPICRFYLANLPGRDIGCLKSGFRFSLDSVFEVKKQYNDCMVWSILDSENGVIEKLSADNVVPECSTQVSVFGMEEYSADEIADTSTLQYRCEIFCSFLMKISTMTNNCFRYLEVFKTAPVRQDYYDTSFRVEKIPDTSLPIYETDSEDEAADRRQLAIYQEELDFVPEDHCSYIKMTIERLQMKINKREESKKQRIEEKGVSSKTTEITLRGKSESATPIDSPPSKTIETTCHGKSGSATLAATREFVPEIVHTESGMILREVEGLPGVFRRINQPPEDEQDEHQARDSQTRRQKRKRKVSRQRKKKKRHVEAVTAGPSGSEQQRRSPRIRHRKGKIAAASSQDCPIVDGSSASQLQSKCKLLRRSKRIRIRDRSPWFSIEPHKLRFNEVRLHILAHEGEGPLETLKAAVKNARQGSLAYKVKRVTPPALPGFFHSNGFLDMKKVVSLKTKWSIKTFWSDSMIKFVEKLGSEVNAKGFLLELGPPISMERIMETVRTIGFDSLTGTYYIFQPSCESLLRVLKNMFGPSSSFKIRDDMLTKDFSVVEVSLLWRTDEPRISVGDPSI